MAVLYARVPPLSASENFLEFGTNTGWVFPECRTRYPPIHVGNKHFMCDVSCTSCLILRIR